MTDFAIRPNNQPAIQPANNAPVQAPVAPSPSPAMQAFEEFLNKPPNILEKPKTEPGLVFDTAADITKNSILSGGA